MKTIKQSTITTGKEGNKLPDNFPHQDDANNAPNKSKTMSTRTPAKGRKAGKLPGGAR